MDLSQKTSGGSGKVHVADMQMELSSIFLQYRKRMDLSCKNKPTKDVIHV